MIRLCCSLLLSCALIAPAQAIDVQALESGDYAKLIQAAPRPTLVALWSIDCLPCHRELPELARLARARRFASVILISTDDLDKKPELARFISEANFPATTRARVFGHTDPARLRHEIDPTWAGETPRHYFYIAKQPPRAWSGPLKLGINDEWPDK